MLQRKFVPVQPSPLSLKVGGHCVCDWIPYVSRYQNTPELGTLHVLPTSANHPTRAHMAPYMNGWCWGWNLTAVYVTGPHI